MKKLSVSLFLSLTLTLPMAFTNAYAATVVFDHDRHLDQIILGISTINATGATMAGMRVTITYLNAPVDKVSWLSLTDNSGGITVGDGPYTLGLKQSDSTWDHTWSLFNNHSSNIIKSIMIDGGAALDGNTVVFDTYFSRVRGTAGSRGGGYRFALGDFNFTTTHTGFNIDELIVTYSGRVGIYGAGGQFNADPVGDLYRYFTLDFGVNGFTQGDTLLFGVDTDMLDGATNPVPLPGAVLLFGAGLLALAGMTRRKKEQQ